MVRFDVLAVWLGGLALGVAAWWAVLAWLGPAVLLAAVAGVAAVALVGGGAQVGAVRGRGRPVAPTGRPDRGVR